MSDMLQHKIFNIPAGLPFSKSLVQFLLQETQSDPERLTQYRVLLPTRRACRVVREAFLNMNDGKPLLLPQMTPLGDVNEEDLSLMIFGNNQSFIDIPEAIAPLKRQLLLAKLIRAVPEFVQGPEHALALAQALCQFMDQVMVEGLDLADLHKIVPDEFASHWQITLNFLKIISENWPKMLAEHNFIDAAQRRNMLLQALAQHWIETPPDYPVIAAGSTGSIPAAGVLLGVISQMKSGRVILPGLDLDLDDEAWGYIAESHPQHGFKVLLNRIGVDRKDIKNLCVDDRMDARRLLAAEIMLPAQVTARWKTFGSRCNIDSMLHNVQYFSCPTQHEEAALISLLMRETLEDKSKVTALVTPDRILARRVSALCRRWGIEVDDSAGQNVMDSRLGKFIALSSEVACGDFNPVTMLALLKMSQCRFGQDERRYNNIVSALEVDILRQDDPIASVHALRLKISNKTGSDQVLAFVDAFFEALNPLSYFARQTNPQNFLELLKAHIRVIEALAATEMQDGADLLWRGDMGEAAAMFLTDLSQYAPLIDDVTALEYQAILGTLMHGVTVRSAYGVHPRLLILGQLEARLSDADLVVLGELNEGVWPPDSKHDPWMSRPMRSIFGLPSTDQAIGIAAHDFVQAFCAPKVVLTRSEKLEGSPTVPARWIDRLDVVLQGCGKTLSDLSQAPYLAWVKQLDHPEYVLPYTRPEPRPPVSVRPQRVSVTKVDVWMQNPYAIYMHYVLKLRKLQPLVQDNDAALRGKLLHEILDRFTQKYPVALPENAEDLLIEIGRSVLTERLESPEMMRYWWPKFMKIADWFVVHEKSWRQDAKFLESEIKGNVDIDIDGIPFNLYGMADRIDRMHGGYALIDYKTGGTFSGLKKGAVPQLPLEAVIVAQGGLGRGFNHTRSAEDKKPIIPAGSVKYLGYWKLSGGAQTAETFEIYENVDDVIETVLNGFKSMISVFRDVQTPFYCIPDMSNVPRFNDYEHVSRLKEWAALDDAENDGEAA